MELLETTTTTINNIISISKEIIAKILNLINIFINTESYPFLDKYPVFKYALVFIIMVIIILCILLILLNSYTGIRQIFNDIFAIDSYKYINTFDINLENNFKKLYLPEFILSCIGLAALIGIFLYIRSYEKRINKSDNK